MRFCGALEVIRKIERDIDQLEKQEISIKRDTSKKCRFFEKHGYCRRRKYCTYVHKIAIDYYVPPLYSPILKDEEIWLRI